MSPQVTVAIVSWNTRELLRRCLLSFEAVARAGLAEVWVIDNASSDGSAAMVRQDFEWAHLVEAEENLGFGRAVNEIARRSRAPWIAPANADVELVEGALEALLAAAEDPAVGAVAPRLVTSDGTTQHSVHAFPTVTLAMLFAVGAYRLPGVGDRLCIEGYWDPTHPRRVAWAHGAFLLVRRAAWDEVGGFDPGQWMYAEDIDLHWRLARAGWIARYAPEARVHHAVSAAAIKAFGASRTRRHLLATYEWQARRRGYAIAWACAGLNAAGAGARWVAFAVAGVAAPRHRTTRRRLGVYLRAHLAALRGPAALRRAVSAPPGEPA